MIDDGQHYKYVYDAFGRLRRVLAQNDDLVAEYRYNGLNQRITAHFDTNGVDGVTGADVVSHFAYDARWRIVARYEDANSDPAEQFVFHHAGLASTGSGSYIDAVLLRDRDTHLHWGANGTLDERVYHLHNWRSDVVALISHAGSQIEQVRYEPYGTPFGMPAGDVDSDGDFDASDVAVMTGSYDVRKDVTMDGTIDYDDVYAAVNIAASYQYLGRGILSSPPIGSRKGYASYEHLAELEGSGAKWDVRNRVLLSDIGSWTRRDPIGYVDGMNLYAYVSLMPIFAMDPSGLCYLTGPPDHLEMPIVSDSGQISHGGYRMRLRVERDWQTQTISPTKRNIYFSGYYLWLNARHVGGWGPNVYRNKNGTLLRRTVTIDCDEDCDVRASVIDGVEPIPEPLGVSRV